MTTPDSDDETPREEPARLGAETYAELSDLADAPGLSPASREVALLVRDTITAMAATGVGQDIRVAEQEQATAGLQAILTDDDTAVIAAALRRRLTREQLADLIRRLDSPA